MMGQDEITEKWEILAQRLIKILVYLIFAGVALIILIVIARGVFYFATMPFQLGGL